MLKILCLTWTPKGSRRMREICLILKADIWNYSIFYRMRLLAPVKYAIQAIKTFIKLTKTKPNVIVVQNPPIFAALTCLVYSRLFEVQIVIDHHYIWSLSGVLKNSLIRSFIDAVEKACIKKANLNTTYADPWGHELTSLSGKNALTIYDFVDDAWPKEADLSIRKSFPEDKKVVAMPVGGHPLERIDLLIEACKDLNVMVVVTGKKRFLQKHIAAARKLKLRNVIFAGFLPDRRYRGLIATCDLVANISEEPYGIPHALCEALASGRPMIISENLAVKRLLGDHCPFILSNNDVNTIKDAFLSAFRNQQEYVKLAVKLYEDLKVRRKKQVERLFENIRGYKS